MLHARTVPIRPALLLLFISWGASVVVGIHFFRMTKQMASSSARAVLTEVACGLTETEANDLCIARQAAHESDPNNKPCRALSYNHGDQRPLTTSTTAIGCAWLYSSPHVVMEHRDGWVSAVASSYCPQGTEKDGSSCNSCLQGKWASDQYRQGEQCEPFPFYSNGQGDQYFADGHFPCVGGREGSCSNWAGLKSLSSWTWCAPGQYRNDDPDTGASCQNCAAGRYKDIWGPDILSCIFCAEGRYSPADGATRCYDCASGYHQPQRGTTACIECATGKFVDSTGGSTCLVLNSPSSGKRISARTQDCPVGSVAPLTGSALCSPCVAGKFSPETGLETCTDCAQGFYGASPGLSACTGCEPGRFIAQQGQSTCTDCAAGTFQSAAQTSCDDCAIGRFGSLAGMSVCVDCIGGKYNDVAASTTCTSCQAGKHVPSTAATECTDCAAGRIQPVVGQLQCPLCPLGKFQSSAGTTSCVDCGATEISTTLGTTACTAQLACTVQNPWQCGNFGHTSVAAKCCQVCHWSECRSVASLLQQGSAASSSVTLHATCLNPHGTHDC